MCWDALSDQWERYYLEAVANYWEHCNPLGYISPYGIRLGNWIAHLRMNRKDEGGGRLTYDQVRWLDRIGMA